MRKQILVTLSLLFAGTGVTNISVIGPDAVFAQDEKKSELSDADKNMMEAIRKSGGQVMELAPKRFAIDRCLSSGRRRHH